VAPGASATPRTARPPSWVTLATKGTLTPADVTDVNGIIAGVLLAAAVAAWIRDLVPGELRERHMSAAAVVDRYAPDIPLTVDDAQALRSDLLRTPWLEACDAVAVMDSCIDLIVSAQNTRLYPVSSRDPAGQFIGCWNVYRLDDPRLVTTSGFGSIRSTLPEHHVHAMLEMSRRGAKWSLNAVEQQNVAAATWLDATPAESERLSGEQSRHDDARRPPTDPRPTREAGHLRPCQLGGCAADRGRRGATARHPGEA
jgi:hypothetical protein